MARRWRDPAAFLVDPTQAGGRPGRRQAVALLVVLLLAAAGAAAASWLVRPAQAQAFDLFAGSVYINDVRAPVAVDLATGKPTVRLRQANDQVGATTSSDLAVSPVTDGTLLLNRASGEFNMVDSTGFVIKLTGGVPLPPRSDATRSLGVAAGPLAYIVRSPTDQTVTTTTQTDVYLVGPATVQAAASSGAAVNPRAFRTVPGRLAGGDAPAVAANGDLWLVVDTASGRRVEHL
ncbi:MAG: hypothetical protein ACTHMS_16445, partial [Jatrophihabitans sp.]|uniref:hypothetical protein n=1 Tax=Jatrophihabitans sp. TaxID=1932789 RepID=UPI003F823392